MLFTNTLREKFFQSAYLEVTLIMITYFAIGFLTDPNDICMINTKFSVLTFTLALITLFHGILPGVYAILLFGVVMRVGYETFDYIYFLREFVLVLVFGEFHYYWDQKIIKQKVEWEFTNKRVAELGKAFYMLKVSHDQIEKSYVVKPMSLRNAIYSIKEKFTSKESKEGYIDFLLLIKKTLTIEKAYLVAIDEDGESFEILSQSNEKDLFDSKDPLMRDTLLRKMPLYVSDGEKYQSSRYLAVIPAVTQNKVVGLLAIEEMPFLAFNRDNLISVSILINYLFFEIEKIKILKTIKDFLPFFRDNFRFECYRLHQIELHHNVASSILVFKTKEPIVTHLLREEIHMHLRTLDIKTELQTEAFDVTAILFPLTDKISIEGFIERATNKSAFSNENLEYSSFLLSELDLMKAYIGLT